MMIIHGVGVSDSFWVLILDCLEMEKVSWSLIIM